MFSLFIFFNYQKHDSFAKSLVAQLTPLGVSNGEVQCSNPPLPHCNYRIIKNK